MVIDTGVPSPDRSGNPSLYNDLNLVFSKFHLQRIAGNSS